MATTEINDLNLMIQTLNYYKELLEKDGNLNNEQQRILRMSVEQDFNNWFKDHGEW